MGPPLLPEVTTNGTERPPTGADPQPVFSLLKAPSFLGASLPTCSSPPGMLTRLQVSRSSVGFTLKRARTGGQLPRQCKEAFLALESAAPHNPF